MESSYYLFTQIGFALVTIAFYGLAINQLRKGLAAAGFGQARKTRVLVLTISGLVIWMVFISVLSLKGVFSDFSSFPPKIVLVLIIPLIVSIALVLSKTVKEFALFIPVENIMALQVFRVLVEILLWMLLIQKLAPVQMTFEGRNFDILAGLSGPIVAYFYAKKRLGRKTAIAWNIIGLGLLFNILGIAILSMPIPLRIFMNEPANTIVSRFPIIWLPGFLVPLAYGLHFFSLRQLLLKK